MFQLSKVTKVNQGHGNDENHQELVDGMEEKPREAPRVVDRVRSFQTPENCRQRECEDKSVLPSADGPKGAEIESRTCNSAPSKVLTL